MVASAKNGAPNLEPESEISGTDILTAGNKSQLGGPAGAGNTAVVETVTPGSAAPTSTEAAPAAEGAASATAPGSGRSSGDATARRGGWQRRKRAGYAACNGREQDRRVAKHGRQERRDEGIEQQEKEGAAESDSLVVRD